MRSIEFYVDQSDDFYTISLGRNGEILHTPEGAAIRVENKALIEEVVLNLQRFREVPMNGNAIDLKALGAFTFYSMLSSHIDARPEWKSVDKAAFTDALKGDPLCHYSAGPEQVDQIYQTRFVSDYLASQGFLLADLQYHVEDEGARLMLADRIFADYQAFTDVELTVFANAWASTESLLIAWVFVAKPLSPFEFATVVSGAPHMDEVHAYSEASEEDFEATLGSYRQELFDHFSAFSEAAQKLLAICAQPSHPIEKLISERESKKLEFKSTFFMNIHTSEKDKSISHASIKTIAAFMNSEGGSLLVGVADDGGVNGVDEEIEKFFRGSDDKYLLGVKDTIKAAISSYAQHVNWELISISGSRVLSVTIDKSRKPVFVGDDFFIRTNPATEKLTGAELISYTSMRFSSD